MKVKYLLLLLFLGCTELSSAQDLHFSQFNASPLNINPALTGLFNSDFRLITNYRNQWSSITTPFLTYSASADGNYHPSRYRKDFLGFGLLFNEDKAGDAAFSTLQVLPSISYTRAMANDRMFLTYGMQVGIIQKHFNPNDLVFDKQYNGDIVDLGASSGENFKSTTANAFDASTGINAYVAPSEKFNFNTGIAIYHFNKPTFSFTDGQSQPLQPRISLYSTANFKIAKNVDLLPGLMIYTQGGSSEYLAGSYIKFSNTLGKGANVYGGTYFRIKDYDAVILSTRLDIEHFTIGISYDFNVSQLATASKAQGGLELSMLYTFKKFNLSKNRGDACPDFF